MSDAVTKAHSSGSASTENDVTTAMMSLLGDFSTSTIAVSRAVADDDIAGALVDLPPQQECRQPLGVECEVH